MTRAGTRNNATWRLLPMLLAASGCGVGLRVEPEQAPYQPTVQLTEHRFLLGDSMTLTVSVLHAIDIEADFEIPAAGDALKIRRSASDTRRAMPGYATTEFTYELTSLVPGEHRTGPLSIVFSGGDTALPPARVPPLVYTVESARGSGDMTLRSAKPPVVWQGGLSTWLIGLLFAAVAVGCAWGVAYLLRRTPSPAEPRSHRSAGEEALDTLARLRRQWRDGRYEEMDVIVHVSNILRRYIEQQFHLRAPEQTTEEFLVAAASCPALDAQRQKRCQRFLEQCDLIKFARHQPMTSDVEAAFEEVESFVAETTNVEAVAA